MILLAGGYDLSEIVESVTWSGDTKQVSRTLSFTLANKHSDPYLPKAALNEGDTVLMRTDGGKELFRGVIFDIDVTAGSPTVSYLAYDLLYYLIQSDISRVFEASPEKVAETVCGDLGIPFGSAAKTGISVYYPCIRKSAYEAIMAPYTQASRQNGKKYIPVMERGALNIIEMGKPCGILLDGGHNLLDANYKTTMTKMVNRVVVVDSSGNQVGVVEDAASRQKYGTIQKICQQADGKDAFAEAGNMLAQIEQAATAKALSDDRIRAGYSIFVREPVTGLYGRFFIESDAHAFKNASQEVDITLAFDCMMDEKEIQQNEGGSV